MVKIAGRRKDHVAGVETVGVVVEEALLVEIADSLRGAQDRPAQRMTFPETLREQLVDEHVRVVLVDFDLFKNHAPLALNIGRRKDRVEHQVAQHIQRNGHMVGQRLDVEADGFFAGKGVEVAADRVHFAGNVLRGAGTSALEKHVFDKVGDAVGLGRLTAGAGLDPDAHGHRAQMLHALGQHNQAVRQYGAADVSLVIHRHLFEFDCRSTGTLKALGRNPQATDIKFRSEGAPEAPPERKSMHYAELSHDCRFKPTRSLRCSQADEAAEPETASLQRPLFGLDSEALAARMVELGEPAWRGKQLAEALYRQRVAELDGITTLPQALRNKLAEQGWEVGRPAIAQVFQSIDGTERYLIECRSGAGLH